MPAALMLHTVDPKQALLDKIGDISNVEVFQNDVLVAVYIAPERTAGGIIRPDTNRDEDRHQSKVGLIIKAGPKAFEDDGTYTWPADIAVGDWVYFRVSDGWNVTLNGNRDNLCRQLKDSQIRGRVSHPDQIW